MALVAIFAPTGPVIATVLTLVILDLVTGLLAARHQFHPITSSGLKRTVSKTAVYLVATLAAFLVEQYLTPMEMPVMKMVTGLIGMTELKSVLENLDIVSGGSFFKSLVNKLSQGEHDEEDSDPTSPPEPPKAA